MNDTQDAEPGKGGKKASTGRTILEYVVLAVVAIAVALLIQAFLVKPYRIPSESMEDTLLIGDRVLVDRISWRFSDPQRSDIIVFHPPFVGPVLIKRVIGMPGDEISLKDGAVYVNGKQAGRTLCAHAPRKGRPCRRSRSTTGCRGRCSSRTRYPAGNYFVMGDNRIDSGDSREFGPVPRGQLVGKAFARYWPPGRIGGVDYEMAVAGRGRPEERFAFDLAAAGADGAAVAGADEAGRGCLAGPLAVAAVCLDYATLDEAGREALSGLDDSKRLTAPAS